jgi:hypothetical protein
MIIDEIIFAVINNIIYSIMNESLDTSLSSMNNLEMVYLAMLSSFESMRWYT